mgnify:FL=1
MRRAVAHLPLHYGTAPRWLFERMKALGREVVRIMAWEFGPEEVLHRLSDPFWFQALGCLMGFDWHSSGLTTTVCGALKEGLRGLEEEVGILVAGGKGKRSLETPSELERYGERFSVDADRLIYASRMAAKVDSCALQDGYQLYHHTFFFTFKGTWCVIQQGMNPATRYARRYHWISEGVEDFCCEPHKAICCDARGVTLNLVAKESAEAREAMAEIASEHPERVLRELRPVKELTLPQRHPISREEISEEMLHKVLLKTYERQPKDLEGILAIRGIGPKGVRALSLAAEVIYGKSPSFRDPARFSFAHGGKDRHPYPVDRELYDRTIEALKECLWAAKVGRTEKLEAIQRLSTFYERR